MLPSYFIINTLATAGFFLSLIRHMADAIPSHFCTCFILHKEAAQKLCSVEVYGLIIYFSHLGSLLNLSFLFLGDCNPVLVMTCKKVLKV